MEVDINGDTIIHLTNDPELVRSILAIPGINPNIYDRNGMTPLERAIRNGNREVVEVLLNDESVKVCNAVRYYHEGCPKDLIEKFYTRQGDNYITKYYINNSIQYRYINCCDDLIIVNV